MKLLFFIVFAIHNYAFANSQCLDAKDVAIISNELDLDLDHPIDVCDRNNHGHRILSALILMKNVELSSVQISAPLNQDIITINYWDYFKNAVRTVTDLTAQTPECSSGAHAYAIEMTAGRGLVGICPIFYESYTPLSSIPLLLHERRHLDGYEFNHDTCSTGQFKGWIGGCDVRLLDMGAYAVSVETGLKLSYANDISPIDQFTLRIEALSFGHARFNVSFRQSGLEGIYLVSEDGKSAYIYQDGRPLVSMSPAEGRAFSRTYSLLIQPNDKSNIYSPDVFDGSSGKFPSLGGYAYRYNNLPSEQRPSFIDTFSDAYGAYSNFGTLFSIKIGEMPNYYDIEFPWEPIETFAAAEYGWPSNDSFFARNSKGEVLQIKIILDTQGQFISSELIPIQDLLPNFKKIIVLGNKRLGLTQNGEIKIFDVTAGWIPFTPVGSLRFSQITRPFAWSQDLWKK